MSNLIKNYVQLYYTDWASCFVPRRAYADRYCGPDEFHTFVGVRLCLASA